MSNSNVDNVDWTIFYNVLLVRTLHINDHSWLTCIDPTRARGELSVGAGPCMQTYHAQQWRHTRQVTLHISLQQLHIVIL